MVRFVICLLFEIDKFATFLSHILSNLLVFTCSSHDHLLEHFHVIFLQVFYAIRLIKIQLTRHNFLLGMLKDDSMQFDEGMIINLTFGVTLKWSTFYQVVFEENEMNVFFVFFSTEEIFTVPSTIGDYDPNQDEEGCYKYVSLEVLPTRRFNESHVKLVTKCRNQPFHHRRPFLSFTSHIEYLRSTVE